MRNKKVLWICKISVFAGLSAVLYFLRFPLAFLFPSFLEIQFSNLPAIIGGFSLGPISGITILIVRTVLVLPFTQSLSVGEIADLLIGIAVVLTTSLIYRKNKTKKGGEIALLFGALVWIISAIIANYFILVSFFIKTYLKNDVTAFINTCNVITKIFGVELTTNNYKEMYVLFAALPFNILLSTIVMIVTLIVYKKISFLIHRIDNQFIEEKEE